MAKSAVKKKAPPPKVVAKKSPPKPKVVARTEPKKPAPTPAKAVAGHNSGIDKAALRSVVDRIVNLEEEKRGIGDDIKEIYTVAKDKGLAPRIVRKIVAIELADKEKLREEKELLEQYLFVLDPELADVLS